MEDIEYYQQGDVILFKIEELPPAKELVLRKDKIIAEGEATGHHHQVFGNANVFNAPGKQMFLEVINQSCLRHEQHKKIELPAGLYRIEGIREKDHFSEAIRRVVD